MKSGKPLVVRLALAAIVMTGIALAAGCTITPTDAPTPTPTATAPLLSPPASTPSITEPTTTNTLQPPPEPTAPAASTAGTLSATSLPVPVGWTTAVLPGGDEEGYRGNGTWVHARDPRYAAQDVVSVGCADVTRDDYTDPTAALEGNYRKGEQTGVGLVLEFGDVAAAQRYLGLYVAQVKACAAPGQEPQTTVVSEPVPADGGQGLIDRRTYDDADWTEVAELNGTRLTLIILGDPDHRITATTANAILGQIRP